MRLITQLKLLIFMLVLATFTQGCITSSLWGRIDHSPGNRYLATAPQTNDILVFYTDQIYYRDHNVDRYFWQFQPRAYWLFASTNAPRHRLPEFVDVTNTSDLVKVPIIYLTKSKSTNVPQALHCFSSVIVTNAPPKQGYYALVNNNYRGAPYQLWRDGKKIGKFKSPPSYWEWGQPTFWRVALTPLTGATDLAMLAAWAYVMNGGHR